MNGTGTRAARAALDAARAAAEQLERTTGADDAAASIIEAWGSVEQSLQAMAGTQALTGQALLRELRQRDLLSLAEAHALIDFGSLADRARAADYAPTARDRETVRSAVEELSRVMSRGGVPGARTPAPAAQAVAPLPDESPAGSTPASPSGNLLGRILMAVVILAVLGGGGYAWFAMTREPQELRRGRAAWAAGDRLTAQSAFEAAATRRPALAEPHIYLGRMAREAGDIPRANDELRRAVSLEPANYLAHRELAALMLVMQRPDLARSFYERAIRIRPDDKTSLGYMGCTLIQLGRPDLAQRFLARAGSGPWSGCVQLVPAPLSPPAAPPR